MFDFFATVKLFDFFDNNWLNLGEILNSLLGSKVGDTVAHSWISKTIPPKAKRIIIVTSTQNRHDKEQCLYEGNSGMGQFRAIANPIL